MKYNYICTNILQFRYYDLNYYGLYDFFNNKTKLAYILNIFWFKIMNFTQISIDHDNTLEWIKNKHNLRFLQGCLLVSNLQTPSCTLVGCDLESGGLRLGACAVYTCIHEVFHTP